MRTWPKFFIQNLPARSDKRTLCAENAFKKGILAALLIGLIAAAVLSLRCGSRDIPVKDMLLALRAGDADAPIWRILVHVRVPRTLACTLAGCALALSGVLIQSVLNNAMASPNVIGVNAGAGFFAMLASILLPGMTGVPSAAAFAGALCSALFIYVLALRAGLSRTTLILAGVAMSSILNAGINALTLFFPEASIGAAGFMLGGFSGVTLYAICNALPYLAAGFLLAAFISTDLNILQLGEEGAASLGLHVGRTRFLSILAAALLAGASVSFSGLLGFVGLLFPHIARRLIGNDNRYLMPAASLLGGMFVLLCGYIRPCGVFPLRTPRRHRHVAFRGAVFSVFTALRQKEPCI